MTNKSPINEICDSGKIVTVKSEISQLFNNYFINTCNNLNISPNFTAAHNLLSRQDMPRSILFSLGFISENDVIKSIKNIKTSKAAGYDEIPTFLIKECASLFHGP